MSSRQILDLPDSVPAAAARIPFQEPRGSQRATRSASLANLLSQALVNPFAGQAGAVARPILERLGERLCAKDFGAVGDGIADDQPALQRAIDAAATGGGIVDLGARGWTYRVRGTLTLKTGVVLVSGVRFGATIRARAADQVQTLLNCAPGAARLGAANLRFINGYKDGTGDVITANEGVTDLFLDGCFIGGDPADDNTLPGLYRNRGIRLDDRGIRRVSVTRCSFSHVKYGFLVDVNPVDFPGGMTQAGGIQDVLVAACQFDAIAGDAIELNAPGASDAQGEPINRRFTIADNMIRVPIGIASDDETKNAAGLGIGCAEVADVVIKGNHIVGRSQAIHIEDDCRRVAIIGNTLEHNAAAEGTNVANLMHLMDGDDIRVIGNHLHRSLGHGINVVYAAGMRTRRLLIQGNVIEGCAGIGIFVGSVEASEGVHYHLADNQIHGCNRGIKVSGRGALVQLVDNMVSASVGDGIQLGGDAPLVRCEGNVVHGSGGSDLVNQNATFWQAIGSIRHATLKLAAGPAAATLGPLGILPIGRELRGLVLIRASEGWAGASRIQRLFEVNWDGTTLSSTAQRTAIVGTLTDLQLTEASGQLAVTLTNSASMAGKSYVFETMLLAGAAYLL